MSGYTKGPWHLDERGRESHEREIACGAGGWFLLLSAGYQFSKMADPAEAEKEFRANAALIASAPELLEALQNIKRFGELANVGVGELIARLETQ